MAPKVLKAIQVGLMSPKTNMDIAKDISKAYGLTVATANNYVNQVCHKAGFNSRLEYMSYHYHEAVHKLDELKAIKTKLKG